MGQYQQLADAFAQEVMQAVRDKADKRQQAVQAAKAMIGCDLDELAGDLTAALRDKADGLKLRVAATPWQTGFMDASMLSTLSFANDDGLDEELTIEVRPGEAVLVGGEAVEPPAKVIDAISARALAMIKDAL
jgi:hypothetical protein